MSPLNDRGTSGLASSGGVISSLPSVLVHTRTDGPEYAGGDLDVAHFGHVGDGARPLPKKGRHHVLGHGVLGAVDLHVADQGPVGLDEPCV